MLSLILLLLALNEFNVATVVGFEQSEFDGMERMRDSMKSRRQRMKQALNLINDNNFGRFLKTEMDNLESGKFEVKKRALDALEGAGFGMEKRALDALEGAGFGMEKRALDALEGAGFGMKKRALDALEGAGFGMRKRALDALEGEGFGMRKRALDALEGEGFGMRKRALDALEGEGFGMRKRALDALQMRYQLKKKVNNLKNDGFNRLLNHPDQSSGFRTSRFHINRFSTNGRHSPSRTLISPGKFME